MADYPWGPETPAEPAEPETKNLIVHGLVETVKGVKVSNGKTPDTGHGIGVPEP